MATYFKITNINECHHDFQYRDGLNVLVEEFNDNPDDSCCAGGFYFTTIEHIHRFYDFGINLRVVTLPTNDPTFKMVMDYEGDKWRANQIILGEKYSLDDLETYKKFDIPYPTLYTIAKNNLLNIAKFLLETSNIRKKKNMNFSLVAATRAGNIKMVQLLIQHGAYIHTQCDYIFEIAAMNGDLEMIKFLVENGININDDDCIVFQRVVKRGQLKIVKYLVEKGVDIHVRNDKVLEYAVTHCHFDIAKFLIESGSDVAMMNSNVQNKLRQIGLLVDH